jgi:lipopolysaccharide transport system permease protein
MAQAFVAVPAGLWRHRDLIGQLTRRELASRYRGSMLGFAWSLVTPLLMLAVYTLLFGVIFRARWGISSSEGHLDFALILFVGLTVYTLAAECLTRAPSLIVANTNLVKRVVFPLDVLAWSLVGASLVNAGLSLLVWMVAALAAGLAPGWTIVWVPIVLAPLVLLTVGCVWALSALGVYLRDTSHAMQVVMSILLFLSPVFYRVDVVPPGVRFLITLNPLTFFIEAMRQVLVWHHAPDQTMLAVAYVGGAVAAAAGLACFQRARRGFGDVL